MCTLIGLALNLAGTVMVAFTFKRGHVEAYQEKDKNPKMESMVQYRRWLFRVGIVLISIGFLLQFIGAWPQG